MKFWNKTFDEMTVKDLTIWAVTLGVIDFGCSFVYRYCWGALNNIFHK